VAYTQADLDAIEKAIKSGALTVEYQDRKIVYRNFDDMIRTRDLILNAVNPASPNDTGRIFSGSRTSKGLGPASSDVVNRYLPPFE